MAASSMSENCLCRWANLPRLLVLASTTAVIAPAFAAPVDVSGQISYNYRNSSGAGQPSSAHYYSAGVHLGSYIWQPWFVVWDGGLNVTWQTTDNEGGGDTEDRYWTGSLTTNVFPRSRFPFIGYYERSNSTLVNPDAPAGLQQTDVRSEQLRLQQSYTTYGGAQLNGWYSIGKWSASDRADIDTSGAGLSASHRFGHQSFQATGGVSETEDQGTRAGTSTNLLTLTHNYTPHTEFNVNTLVTQTSTEHTTGATATTPSTTITDDLLQASSNFFWRPEYRAVSATGSLRFANIERNSSSSNTLDGFLGASYQYTKSLRFNASVSVAAHDTTSGDRALTSTQSLSSTYSSDSYYLQSWAYRWQISGSLANNMSNASNNADSATATVGFNHDLQRSWGLTQVARMDLSLGQGISGGVSTGAGDTSYGLTHTARLAWNSNTPEASTSTWVQASDSRTFGAGDSAYQSLNWQFTRRQNVDRLSSLTGNVTVGATRQSGGAGPDDTNTSATGTVDYSHSRFLNVYRLRFLSRLELSRASIYESDSRQTSRWNNRLDYSIGMIVASATFDYQRDNVGFDNRTFLFQVTRRF